MSNTPRTTAPEAELSESRNHIVVSPSRVGWGEKVAYGLGDFASNMSWTTITTYLLFFYTNVALIPAAVTGVLFLVARIIDAVIDPFIGIWLDRTNTRFGRARPFLLFGAIPLAVLTTLSFVTPDADQGIQIAWAFGTFLIVGILYSVVNIPYGALMPMMTRDSKVRLQLGSLRIAGLAIATLLISLATMPLVEYFGQGNQQIGFVTVVGLYSLLSVIGFFLVFAICKERVYKAKSIAARTTKEPLRPAIKAAFRNRPWLSVFISSVFAFTRLGVILGGAVYYGMYVLEASWAVGILLTSYGIAMLLGSALCPPILLRLGRRNGTLLGLGINIVATALLFTFMDNVWVSCALFFVASVVGGFGLIAAPPMVADSVDYQEYRTGTRNEGLLYSGYSFGTKVGNAVGAALFAGFLAWFAYDPTQLTEGAIFGIALAFIAIPIGLAILQGIALAFYDLDAKHAGIVESLRAREAA
ncbi:MFS transporter [Microbacterium sp. 22215]|uniref:MFS transporter n=1 Tax=Microbacterium sp. 22215 TaxID=3453893 RepID=UPI003F87F62B